MKEYVEQMIEREHELMRKIAYLEEDKVYADGGAYSEITLRIARLNHSLNQIRTEIYNYTFVGPKMPESVRSERNQKVLDEARKSRIQSALEKLNKIFGGK